jgi:hypothetical protein
MKNLLLTFSTLILVGFMTVASAQIRTPASSPLCKVTGTVGLTDVTIEYSRPSVKGRTIFGGLVPYNETWRTGANRNSTITFSEKVNIGGKDIKKGTYALFTVPGSSEWEVILYTDTENWGLPVKWEAAKEAVRFKVPSQTLPFSIETMLISMDNLSNNSFDLVLAWENTILAFPVGLSTSETVNADIKRVMAGPTAGDYYNAGNYLYQEGKDLKQAHEWVNKANTMDPRFFRIRTEALILADMGKYTEAVAVGEKALALAKEAGNNDYVRMNEESLAKWRPLVPPPAPAPAPAQKTTKKAKGK